LGVFAFPSRPSRSPLPKDHNQRCFGPQRVLRLQRPKDSLGRWCFGDCIVCLFVWVGFWSCATVAKFFFFFLLFFLSRFFLLFSLLLSLPSSDNYPGFSFNFLIVLIILLVFFFFFSPFFSRFFSFSFTFFLLLSFHFFLENVQVSSSSSRLRPVADGQIGFHGQPHLPVLRGGERCYPALPQAQSWTRIHFIPCGSRKQQNGLPGGISCH